MLYHYRCTIEGMTLLYHCQKAKQTACYHLIITEIYQNKRRTFTLDNIAKTKREALRVARFFCENTVTPEHAEEIFEEYFGYLAFFR